MRGSLGLSSKPRGGSLTDFGFRNRFGFFGPIDGLDLHSVIGPIQDDHARDDNRKEQQQNGRRHPTRDVTKQAF